MLEKSDRNLPGSATLAPQGSGIPIPEGFQVGIWGQGSVVALEVLGMVGLNGLQGLFQPKQFRDP